MKMDGWGPDFIIIGAMKCGTSTLAAQLAYQSGVFMTSPKEPNFFSDDNIYAQGYGWYRSLFVAAAPDDLKGEASTHYTKLPTYPNCAARLHEALPGAKLIYVMRDPIERLISQYIHEWSLGQVRVSIDEALQSRPELVEYSRYSRQLEPYLARWDAKDVLLLRLEDMQRAPQAVIERIASFLGRPGTFVWREELDRENVSALRIRRFPFYDLVVDHPAAAALRRALVPRALRSTIKRRLQMRTRPVLTKMVRVRLAEQLADDIEIWRNVAYHEEAGTAG